MLSSIARAYNQAVYETDRDAALQVVEAALAQGVRPEEIVFEVVIPGIEEMMSLVTRDPDANLAQHFMAAQIASEVTDRMLARFERPPEKAASVVIGTAAGDLHSLGKRIVAGCLRANMVEVTDVGVNAPAQRFVDEALRVGAQVIAVSAMMVHTATGPDGPVRVRALLRERGLEGRLRLVVGGAPYRFDDQLYRAVGADGWAADGVTAGRVILDLAKEVRAP